MSKPTVPLQTGASDDQFPFLQVNTGFPDRINPLRQEKLQFCPLVAFTQFPLATPLAGDSREGQSGARVVVAAVVVVA